LAFSTVGRAANEGARRSFLGAIEAIKPKPDCTGFARRE